MTAKKETDKKRIIRYIISIILVVFLVFMQFKTQRSFPRIGIAIALSFAALILPKKINPEAFFRSYCLFSALMPNISFSIVPQKEALGFSGFKAFAQIWIMYSSIFKIFIPTAALIAIIFFAIKKESDKESSLNFRKYLPLYILMPISFAVSVIFNFLSGIGLFLFTYCVIVMFVDLYERYIYNHTERLIANLPFVFLLITALYRIR